jgi:hypothetical protein
VGKVEVKRPLGKWEDNKMDFEEILSGSELY